MPSISPPSLRIRWVLRQSLALGPPPATSLHLVQMERFGIRAVLSLCAADEQIPLPELQQRFAWARVVLPDHRSPNRLTRSQLNAALKALEDLQRTGPVYVHCMAARERSPLICMAWLMGKRGLSMQEALEYVSQLHPGTNPLPQHLALLAESI